MSKIDELIEEAWTKQNSMASTMRQDDADLVSAKKYLATLRIIKEQGEALKFYSWEHNGRGDLANYSEDITEDSGDKADQALASTATQLNQL